MRRFTIPRKTYTNWRYRITLVVVACAAIAWGCHRSTSVETGQAVEPGRGENPSDRQATAVSTESAQAAADENAEPAGPGAADRPETPAAPVGETATIAEDGGEKPAATADAETEPSDDNEPARQAGLEPTAEHPDPTREPEDRAHAEAAAGEDAGHEQKDETFPYKMRIKAPDLSGGAGWLNTAGPLKLADLKGKFVLLDFWTYCCINCMHILPELKKLEAAYPNELVVIGVHSAKFDGEEDSQNIREAIQRYDIEHPVVNDARHHIWQRYYIESWPTVILIDPEGNAVWGMRGEIKFGDVDPEIQRGLGYYRAKGVLDETPLRFDLERFKAQPTALRFPGKVAADEAGDRLAIADSNHHRIVVTRLDGTLIATVGCGRLGSDDGDFNTASFNHPQGMTLRGETLYVADTENHLLRKVDFVAGQVTTVAGVGRQARGLWPGMSVNDDGSLNLPKRFVGKPLETALNSPWDLWIHGEHLYIAMAGPHQVWKMPLDESEIGPYAGNGREDIVDGPLLPNEPYEPGYCSFAQPSGLTSDGKTLFVADSEGSSIRAVPFDPTGEVTTVVGTSRLVYNRLFTFGDVDGQGAKVRLQHALGVASWDGRLYVADTYNDKIKELDPEKAICRTLALGDEPVESEPAGFDEPAGISAAAGKLFVADTNHHRIRVIDLKNGNRVSTLQILGLEPPEAAEPEPQELKVE